MSSTCVGNAQLEKAKPGMFSCYLSGNIMCQEIHGLDAVGPDIIVANFLRQQFQVVWGTRLFVSSVPGCSLVDLSKSSLLFEHDGFKTLPS